MHDRFLRGRQLASMIYEYFRVTGAHDAVLDYTDLFTLTLRNDDVQEFDTRWGKIVLSMSKVPTDDVLESLYTFRIRESDQLKIVLGLYELEIQQHISKLDYQKLQITVKRSIDQRIKSRNTQARNDRNETGTVMKNRRDKSCVPRRPGECYQWKGAGQCARGDNFSFRHDGNKSGKSTPKYDLFSEPRKDGEHLSRKTSPLRWESVWEVKSKDVQRLPRR